jgi:hypothetical protein
MTAATSAGYSSSSAASSRADARLPAPDARITTVTGVADGMASRVILLELGGA